MGKRISFILVLACLFTISVISQTTLTLRGNLDYTVDVSDIWGYAAAGKEYALLGVENGFAIIDVTNPDSLRQLFFINGSTTFWRDVKTWSHYAYIVNEGGGGLLIVDLGNLPNTINTYTWTGNGFSTAHNLFIDENDYAYICGANIYNGGVFILNLNTNPVNPPVVGAYTRAYVHDLFVRGDTMWTAEINNGQFGVVNVSNKANPQLLALQNTPGNFAHNVWLSANGKYLFTTDEISGGVIAAYDVSDLNNISELGRFQSNPGSRVIPHNVFWHQDFLVISYYRDGVVIADATYPNNIIQTGAYDTSPLSGNGFNGCWGVYPYLPSGNILASDIESGLFVLTPAYVHACFLEGLVSDSTTGLPLNGVTIELVNQNITTQSGLDGRYYTGIATAGSYSVRFSKQGYITRTVPAVPLTNGNLVTLNVALIPSTTFTLTGTVTDTANGNGIEAAQIFITDNASKSWTVTTDVQGNFSINNFETGSYDIFFGKWGYITRHIQQMILPGTTLNLSLTAGYYDDFIFDYGWMVSGNASTGMWERDIPIGTTYNGSQVNPANDITDDSGEQCYVTGNGGGSAGTDDVDNGYTVLKSPVMDLSGYQDPYIQYYMWFFNGGGSSTPDDTMIVRISNGANTVDLITYNRQSPMSQWVKQKVRIRDYIQPTNNMQFIIRIVDAGNGHLVEGGLDGFAVKDSIVIPPCDSPVALRVTRITPSSARLNWDTVAGAHHYIIRGRKAGTPSWKYFSVAGNTSFLNVYGLPNNTLFEWQVRTACDDAGLLLSPWSVTDSFETGCYAPDSHWTEQISANAAVLRWKKAPGASGYEIRGRKTGGNFVHLLIGSGNTTSKTLHNLRANTTYEWRIRTWCDTAGILKSPYTPLTSFTTLSNTRISRFDGKKEDSLLRWKYIPEMETVMVEFTAQTLNEAIELRLLNINGKILFKNQYIHVGNGPIRLNLSSLPSGIYFLSMVSADHIQAFKIVKN